MRTLIFRNTSVAIGIALVALSAEMVSSTAAAAQSNQRNHGFRSLYRQRNNLGTYRTPEYNIPDAYPVGSSRWWEEMDRQGRGGRK